jgi:hypothetical protein
LSSISRVVLLALAELEERDFGLILGHRPNSGEEF